MAKIKPNKLETRAKLISAGMRLFAEQGFRAVSTRDIAKEAGVNSALISYHFGGKDEFFEVVVRSSVSDHVAERMQMLTKARAKGRELTLETLLELYLQPILNKRKWSHSGDYFTRLHAVVIAEKSELAEDVLSRALSGVNIAFIDELCLLLPHLKRETITWRFYAMIGSFLFLDTDPSPPGMLTVSAGKCDASDHEEVMRQMLPFFVAGLAADEPAQPQSSAVSAQGL
ncbi:TetR/AcrR family transcriptional regulator [Pseudoprimorskyibacter insulae]|uniref:Putative HTH-type transcriptional regulator YttP n=1 Tax=Pseudoprimorskyibacter insulae TaxID=1695997 RepID=A0A2R8AWI1_9RHOB|nr:TetR/AcrR family transcriptional regulator [Pseudoprimorskyibacter insulae]SPF80277.1 putative HTH-type transcriptional regulator YttP [Pseudoprimorskyibacter insulae]